MGVYLEVRPIEAAAEAETERPEQKRTAREDLIATRGPDTLVSASEVEPA